MMNDYVEKLKGKRFLVLGRAGMDLYPDPPGTKTENAERMVAHLGGSSANIAVALARHGCSTSLLTSVSDDAIGRFCVNKLREFGVDTQYVSSVAGEYRTSLAVTESRVIDHQGVLYRNGAADFMMSWSDVDAIDMSQYDALVYTGTLLAEEPSRSATRYALEKAGELGLVRVFDMDYRPYSWSSAEYAASTYQEFADLCEIIVGNDDEFGVMAGDKDLGLASAQEFAQHAGKLAIYKMGAEGARSFYPGGEVQTGIYAVEALKPVGAGDAFMGGFLHSLVEGLDLRTAVLRGSACAAIVVSKVGCSVAMPDQATLKEFLATHTAA